MNIKQWITETLASGKRQAIPIMTNPGIEMCGRNVQEAVTDGTVHAEAILTLNEKYPADAVTAIMDLTVEAEAFGAPIVFSEEEVPTVSDPIVSDLASVEALQIPSLDTARVPEYLKANRIVAEAVTDKPVLAGCIGPFSLAGRLFGLSELMMAMYVEPETVKLLLKKCSTFLDSYIKAIKATGADGVIIAEPAAGLISNEDCTAYSTDYLKPIIADVQDENFMIVLHNCGNKGHCTEAMVASGAWGLHFGNAIDMAAAIKDCPADTLVMGNLDPVGLFKQADTETIGKATRELLEQTAGNQNFILSSGCDVPPLIPEENIRAFYDEVKAFNS